MSNWSPVTKFFITPRRVQASLARLNRDVRRRSPTTTVLLAALLTLAGLARTAWAQEPEPSPTADRPTVLVVVGAGGAPEYQEQFARWADQWRDACEVSEARHFELGRDENQKTSGASRDKDEDSAELSKTATDRDRLMQFIEREAKEPAAPLWLVFLGHGTYYRDMAKFNLRGPDFTAKELAKWLEPLQRPLVVINCASCSGPFLKQLAAANRTVITATRSGAEQNFARFGSYLAAAWSDPRSDLDHDDQVSLLEAYLRAAADVEAFYVGDARLKTEHSLLDDNGDGLGTPATFFRGARAVRSARDNVPVDGSRARRQILASAGRESLTVEQRAERDRLEDQLERLRSQKSSLSEDEYFKKLEAILLPLARIYADTEDA